MNIEQKMCIIFSRFPEIYIDNGIATYPDNFILNEILYSVDETKYYLDNGEIYKLDDINWWSDLCYVWKYRRHILSEQEWYDIIYVLERIHI
jgi:hypothetical protein